MSRVSTGGWGGSIWTTSTPYFSIEASKSCHRVLVLRAPLEVNAWVRPEESTPPYGGNASRMDFLLKPEQVVLKAKMAGKGLGQKELVTQLSEDVLRYQSHQDCKTSCALCTIPPQNAVTLRRSKMTSQRSMVAYR